ncbi:hypothetical protein Tco_0060390 [Tanacetum coccineum]
MLGLESTFLKIGRYWGEVLSSTFLKSTFGEEDESAKDKGINQFESSEQVNLEEESDDEVVSDTHFGDNKEKEGTSNESVINSGAKGNSGNEALGNSGGILCAWDNNVLCKGASYNFRIISLLCVRDVDSLLKMKVLFISVYAHQADSYYKRALWSLFRIACKFVWNGTEHYLWETLIEVRWKEERWESASMRTVHVCFNNFFSNAGLA